MADDEVEPVGGEASDLAQGASPLADRAVDREEPDEHAGGGRQRDADGRAHDRPGSAGADEHVREVERHGAEREMHLA